MTIFSQNIISLFEQTFSVSCSAPALVLAEKETVLLQQAQSTAQVPQPAPHCCRPAKVLPGRRVCTSRSTVATTNWKVYLWMWRGKIESTVKLKSFPLMVTNRSLRIPLPELLGT